MSQQQRRFRTAKTQISLAGWLLASTLIAGEIAFAVIFRKQFTVLGASFISQFVVLCVIILIRWLALRANALQSSRSAAIGCTVGACLGLISQMILVLNATVTLGGDSGIKFASTFSLTREFTSAIVSYAILGWLAAEFIHFAFAKALRIRRSTQGITPRSLLFSWLVGVGVTLFFVVFRNRELGTAIEVQMVMVGSLISAFSAMTFWSPMRDTDYSSTPE